MDRIKGFEARVSSAIIVVSLFLPSVLEPEWLWRLTCILAACVIAVYVSLGFYYQWLIKKRKYYEITAESNTQIRSMSKGQKKWHFFVFLLTIVFTPFLLYISSFPVIDVISISSGKSEIKTEILTLENNNTSMGASIVGQILDFKDQNGNEKKDLFLMFSLEIQKVNKTYEVTYLPYSNLVLEIEEI